MDRDTEEWLRPWRLDGPPRSDERRAGTTTSSDRVPSHRFEPTGVSSVRVRRRTGAFAPPSDPPTTAGAPSAPARSRAGDDRPGASPSRAPAPQDRGRAPRGRARAGLVGLAAGLVGAIVGTTVTLAVVDQGGPTAAGGTGASAVTTPDGAGAPEDSTTRTAVVEGGTADTVVSTVAAAVLPAVVRIDVFVSEDDPDLGVVDVQAGVGSGVVYRSDGYVLTNNHVVDETDTVQVRLADGTQQDAEVVGTDRLTDLAVLRIEADDLTAVTLREDRPLEVGETAIAIGSPFGLDASVTAGVVSATNRDLQVPGEAGASSFVIPATIQTDAAINPGNSGGALVDGTGRLIGINTAIYSGSGGSQGVGFAIPTRSVVAAADQLIERGFVSHPFLGISGLDVTAELAKRYADDHGLELDNGAVIDQVVPESGADTAGLRSGDVIVRFGDEPITGMVDVIAAVFGYDIGQVVTIAVLRDGERMAFDVTLGERPREDGG